MNWKINKLCALEMEMKTILFEQKIESPKTENPTTQTVNFKPPNEPTTAQRTQERIST